MNTAVLLLAPGSRIWHADGLAATVTAIDCDGVRVCVDGETGAVPILLDGWAVALACDTCCSPARVQLRDGLPGQVLCRDCAHDHGGRPAAWVLPIPRTVIRTLHHLCERLS